MIRGSRCLVTGAAGFIGGHLVDALQERGAAEVIALDRSPDAAVTLRLGRDCSAGLRAHLAGIDYVFHLAAVKRAAAERDPVAALDTNIDGTCSLARASAEAGVRRVVFASSLYVYGRDRGAPLAETDVPVPDTVYGVSKLAGEHLLRWCRAEHGLSYNILRYFFAYGPGRAAQGTYHSVITRTCERVLRGKPPIVFGDGRQVLDYVYVGDIVAATIAAAESEVANDVFNVGTGSVVPIIDIVNRIAELAGVRVPIVHEKPDATASSCRVADTRKAAERLRWTPRTDLATGLKRTFEALAAGEGGHT